jgi:hypothetical protein
VSWPQPLIRGSTAPTLALALFSLSACTAGEATIRGSSLQPTFTDVVTLAPLNPGQALGVMDLPLVNRSGEPLTLLSVRATGPGLGDIAAVEETQLVLDVPTIPSGAYTSKPPTTPVRGRCHRAALVPVRGFELAPGEHVRVWFLVRAVSDGAYRSNRNTIRYRQAGEIQEQVLHILFAGTVSKDAPTLRPEKEDRKCLPGTIDLRTGRNVL